MIDRPRIGLRPIPSDGKIAEFLDSLIIDHTEQADEIVNELKETLEETEEEGQPYQFAFGKLLNYLATKNQAELIELCAGAFWNLTE
ncbi:MAG TPA: hypothetical protein PK852_02590 [Mesotoga prima]|uniref:hypothetical protein n=1 Tax=Mesotoga prima TaxID=1184387 RepID=UPI002C388114|nr:hypothetical protein [Mesotoga prima]HPE52983.1 hypothetical protein [Mesotoga prima]